MMPPPHHRQSAGCPPCFPLSLIRSPPPAARCAHGAHASTMPPMRPATPVRLLRHQTDFRSQLQAAAAAHRAISRSRRSRISPAVHQASFPPSSGDLLPLRATPIPSLAYRPHLGRGLSAMVTVQPEWTICTSFLCSATSMVRSPIQRRAHFVDASAAQCSKWPMQFIFSVAMA